MTKILKTITNEDLYNKTILIRVDLNVPVINGLVKDNTRIKSLIPSVMQIVKKNGKVVICSHFGRPNGKKVEKFSLKPLLKILTKEFGMDVKFSPNCVGEEALFKKKRLKNGEILLLENLRFYPGEENNDDEFAKELSSGCDLYVNDAFSCSHRKHASIFGITKFLPSFSGFHLIKEIDALEKVLKKPKKPVVSIIGGSKVSSKIKLINNLSKKMDYIIIGGAMANTFLASLGNNVGNSLYEKNFISVAKEILEVGKKHNCQFILPKDVVISNGFKKNNKNLNVEIANIPSNMMALDIGHDTLSQIQDTILKCRTLLWNGPLGAFEFKPFDKGTNLIANFVSELSKQKKLISVAGGGDTISALNNAGVTDNLSYVSTAGGAFLEWLEGKSLPGISGVLKNK